MGIGPRSRAIGPLASPCKASLERRGSVQPPALRRGAARRRSAQGEVRGHWLRLPPSLHSQHGATGSTQPARQRRRRRRRLAAAAAAADGLAGCRVLPLGLERVRLPMLHTGVAEQPGLSSACGTDVLQESPAEYIVDTAASRGSIDHSRQSG
eukprot:scaffold2065_cov359-Prasinococcus_capsulatus_cf.AAC.1